MNTATAVPGWVPLNLNIRIRFKLTDAHQRAWEASQRRDLGAMYGFAGHALEADDDGWVQMQLWRFAHAFGSELEIGMCAISPVLEMDANDA